jgi:hypothetical protein
MIPADAMPVKTVRQGSIMQLVSLLISQDRKLSLVSPYVPLFI